MFALILVSTLPIESCSTVYILAIEVEPFFKEGHGPQDAKKMLISKTSFRSRENVQVGTKIIFCKDEVSGIKQVSIN